MATPRRAGTDYAFGHSDDETQRLLRQGRLFNPTTRHFFAQAGIGPGMRVLDVGSGAGDVALLLAELVGTAGRVVGVDTSPDVLRTAEARVRAARLENVTFLAGDINDLALAGDFDAVAGRCVLVHNPNPAATLRTAAGHARPGGVIAFQEPAHAALPPTAAPPSPLLERAWGWILEAQRRAGLRMGLRLFEIFLDAGLPAPEMGLHTAAGGGPEWAGYDYVASHLRITLPLIVRHGVATADEVGIDTFAERLRAEVTGQRGAMTTWGFIAAWTRK